jgi:hypothetical protein
VTGVKDRSWAGATEFTSVIETTPRIIGTVFATTVTLLMRKKNMPGRRRTRSL